MAKKHKSPTIKDLCIIAKLEDGTYHQVITTKAQDEYLLRVLSDEMNDGIIKIIDTRLETITWEDKK